MRNQVQLITYADRLGGTIAGTAQVLHDVFGDSVGGVHLLPFFTPYDGADAGFDPVDHTAVDPRLGTWDDVRALARDRDVVVDVIVNHVSADSAAFEDVVRRGGPPSTRPCSSRSTMCSPTARTRPTSPRCTALGPDCRSRR